MKCKNPHPDLFLYFEGNLPEERISAVKRHVEDCMLCSRFLETIGGYNKFIEREKNVAFDPFFYTRIQGRRGSVTGYHRLSLKRFIPALVAATLFAGGVITGINAGKVFPSYNVKPDEALTQERGYVDELDQESIESFFLTTYDEVNE